MINRIKRHYEPEEDTDRHNDDMAEELVRQEKELVELTFMLNELANFVAKKKKVYQENVRKFRKE